MEARRHSIWLPVAVSITAITLSASVLQADPAAISTVPVVDLGAGIPPPADADSTIVRTDNGVTVSVSTEVVPGTYTMWLLWWSNPASQCGGPYMDTGLICNPNVGDTPECVLYNAGKVVGGKKGKLNYTGHRSAGDNSNKVGPPCANGPQNPQTAAIHAIVRYHGPKVPGIVNDQILTFGGGCIGLDPNNPLFACFDPQAAAHELL